MPTTVRVDGLSVLLKNLESIASVSSDKDARKPVSSALRKAGNVVRDAARANVHVQTGTLRDNIIVTKRRKPILGFQYIELDVTVRYKARKYKNNYSNKRTGRAGKTYADYGPLFYGRFLEFGTSHQPAYPFMLPAWEENKDQLAEIFKNDLADSIQQAIRK